MARHREIPGSGLALRGRIASSTPSGGLGRGIVARSRRSALRRGVAGTSQAARLPRLRRCLHARAALGRADVSAEGACAAYYRYRRRDVLGLRTWVLGLRKGRALTRTNFENLRVYLLAEELADEVWKVVRKWEMLASDTVGKQLVRAANSIGATSPRAAARKQPGLPRSCGSPAVRCARPNTGPPCFSP